MISETAVINTLFFIFFVPSLVVVIYQWLWCAVGVWVTSRDEHEAGHSLFHHGWWLLGVLSVYYVVGISLYWLVTY